MDVVDLDELAADAVGEPGRSRRWQRRLPGRRPLAAVSGALVLALLTAGAIVASRDPLRVQVEGMRDGPRVGWSSPQGLSEFVAVDGDRVVTSDDLTIRARRADDGVVEAVESDDPDDRIIGVQWHPELMLDRVAHQRLFDWIVDPDGVAGG